MPFTVDERGVRARRELESGEVFTFGAEGIRKERTGVHACVSIALDGQPLSYDTFNVERDRERVHLVKSAHGRLGELVRRAYSQADMRRDLDTFCAGLWDRWLSRYRAESLGGDPEVPPPSFALEPFILEGGGTILFGPPGRGKSYLGLLMAASIDAGCSTLWPVQQQRVLFVNLERSRISLRRRIGMVNLALGLEQQRPLLFVNARGRSLADVCEAIRRDVEEHGIKVVVLDSLSRAGLGKLTEDVPANSAMDALNALSDTWLALGHTPRADDTHVYGSQMFDAAIDIGVQVLSERKGDGTLGVGLHVTKANDTAIPAMQRLALEFDQYGLFGVRQAHRNEFPELEAGRPMPLTQEVREYLLAVGSGTASEIAEELNRSREKVSRVLQGQSFVRLDRQGKGVPYAVKV